MDERKLDLDLEINKLESILNSRPQLSTMDIALVYNLCDRYIKKRLGVDILSIYERTKESPESITRYLMLSIYDEPKLFNFIKKYGLSSIIAETLNSTGSKKIIRIQDDVILNSNKTPNQMPIPSDTNQIKRIFKALRKNYILYNQLYKGKIWLVNTNDNDGNIIGQERIKISPYTFFHLIGFDKNHLKPNEAGGQELARILPNSREALSRLADFGKHNSANVFYIIEELLKSEENFLQACINGELSNAINIDKIEMKCFSFERMGVIQTASGMIFFDKEVAKRFGYEKEAQHISSDIILLNDFIRKYELDDLFGLDFVISPYSKKKENGVSDQQSIYLTKEPGGGFHSRLFEGQKTSVSSSVAGYREKDFDFSISEEGEFGGDIIFPNGSPVDYTEFSDEERKRVARSILDGFPNVDKTHLDNIITGKGKKK